MKSVLCLTALAAGLAACERPAAPPPAPPAVQVRLTYGLALPWGADVAIQRARASSAYLGKALSAEVVPRLFGYEELAQAIGTGAVDIAFMPPLGYVIAARTGKVALLRRARHASRPEYRSVLFVRRDSKVDSVDDLKGKDVAWVQEGSASGNLFPRGWFFQHKLDPAVFFAHQEFLANHSEVCQAVYTGQAWAGASFTNATADFDKALVDGCQPSLGEKAADLKILFATDPIPNDVIAVRAGLDPAIIRSIGDALDRAADTEEGRAALQHGFASDGFLVAQDSDFDAVRRAVEAMPRAAPPAPAAPPPEAPSPAEAAK